MSAVRNYVLVTGAYWGFTVTDGALRMLVLLHFHELGYTPVELAFLFLFYELFGVVTNLLGGWIAARMGLKTTLTSGLALQVVALLMLSLVAPGWSKGASVAYVMAAQALSGIAKDLTKMSSKSSIKVLVPENASSSLFKWVALLTGSKNALKGVGFFAGGLLLALLGFAGALWTMAGTLLAILLASMASLSSGLGKSKRKPKFRGLLSKSREVNVLSAARFFLFGARDIWFVVAVPVFLSTTLGWTFTEIGSFLAAWVIVYGMVQSIAPAVVSRWTGGLAPQGRSALVLAVLLALATAGIGVGVTVVDRPAPIILGGLAAFGVIFAVSSSVHSYLILAYSDGDEVAMNVGFYYMSNAAGRLVGTLISGIMFQLGGLRGCLWTSAAFAFGAALLSSALPRKAATARMDEMKAEGGGSD